MSDKKRILKDGYTMPVFGLGLWAMEPEETEISVLNAIKAGYRLFDTAAVYGNEIELGKALRGCGLRRDEYFVVTKLLPTLHGYDSTKESLQTSLKKLGLDYVDLFLIHTPKNGKIVESWRACCELKRDGLTKSIGVSNFNVQHLKGLMEAGMEVPTVNQIEFHPWYQEVECYEFCAKNNIAIMAYCPLAQGRMLEDGASPLLETLANKYNKTKAQILLRWAIQYDVIPIPKSSNNERIVENIQLNDFELSDEDMKEMINLNEGIRISKASSVMQDSWNE